MGSRYKNVECGPPIQVFALNKAYNEDTHPNKVNLGVGAYRDEEGLPLVLPVVKRVEQLMSEEVGVAFNHEYLPVLGLESFCTAATKFLLGDCAAVREGRVFGVQALSGTGALRVAAEFLAKQLKYKTFYCSVPTWENHNLVFLSAGFTEAKEYRYWDPATRGIDFAGLITDLRHAPENSVIILHACAHNPTGCDPTKEQWTKIADVMEERKLFPLFDSAYQGFASGNPENDAWAVRYFEERGFEIMCTQSFAKNVGLYNERIGNLTCVLSSKDHIPAVKSQLTLLVRGMYSNPPHHGARIVSMILNNPIFYNEWKVSVQAMASRVKEMREALKTRLVKLGTPGTWDHITTQIGLFSYTGLTSVQCDHLINHYHIYLLGTGRINMCGLNHKNIDYVANAIHQTILDTPSN